MKYAGREAFRAMYLQITKSGVKKIMRPKDGEEVVFRLNQPGSRAKTVKGRIDTFQQHGLTLIFTIQFPEGFYRFIVGNQHQVWGENEFIEYCSRNGRPPFSVYHNESKTDWPEKPIMDGDWLD